MADLAFSSARVEQRNEPVPFTLDGVVFRCRPGINTMALLDVVGSGRGPGGQPDATDSLRSTYQFLRALLTEEDWPRFRAHCIEHETAETTLVEIIQGVLPELVGRPTERPSASPEPPTTSSSASMPGSSSPGTVAASTG